MFSFLKNSYFYICHEKKKEKKAWSDNNKYDLLKFLPLIWLEEEKKKKNCQKSSNIHINTRFEDWHEKKEKKKNF